MPFSAANIPNKLIQLMADLLFEHIGKGYCIVFIDDILIFSWTIEDHVYHVQAVMDMIRKTGFYLYGSKCLFGKSSALFLRFVIDRDDPKGARVQMIHEKIKAISDALPYFPQGDVQLHGSVWGIS